MAYHGTDDVIDAIRSLEQTVKDQWSAGRMLLTVFGIWLVFSIPGAIWHAKWRYALAYNVPSQKVQYEPRPHDCEFLAAPLGDKFCHYEVVVTTVEWATSTTGNPIISYDEGIPQSKV